MISSKKINLTCFLFIFLAALMVALSGCASSRLTVGPQPDGTILIRGKVQKVATQGEITIIKVKPPKGDAVYIRVTPDAACKKSCPIDKMEKDLRVEIIYRTEANDNVAVTVRKIAQGSCE